MKRTISKKRRLAAIALVFALAATAASATAGLSLPSPARPDRHILARLRAAATPRAEAMLVGAKVTVGVARPKTVSLPLAAFATGGKPVTLRRVAVTGPHGRTRVVVHPGMKLRPLAEKPTSRAALLASLADSRPGRAAAFLRQAYSPGIKVPVGDLALDDGTTTTLTVSAEFESAAATSLAVLPLEVSVAALPVQPSWAAGDGHVHDSDWSDGWDSLSTQVSDAKNAGHKWMVVTDHWKGIWAVGGRGNTNWRLYRDDCLAKENAFDIRVLPGTEVMSANNGGHTLAYALDGSRVPPPDGSLSPSALVNAIRNHTPGLSYAVIAHPYSTTMPWSDWGASGFRAMELMSQEPQASASTQSKWFSLLRAGIQTRIAGGPCVVGVANSDAHLPWQRPGEAGVTWIRSDLFTRAAVWNQISTGVCSASGREDLGFCSVNGVQQGGVVAAYPSTTLTFSITQRPVTGRRCTEISIRNSNNVPLWSVSNPTSATYNKSLSAPSADTFYVVKMVFAKTNATDYSHVWCNPVFVDRR